MKRCILLAALSCLPLTGFAQTITLNLGAANLYMADATTLMPQNGLVILVADTEQDGYPLQLQDGYRVATGQSFDNESDDLVVFAGPLGNQLSVDGLFATNLSFTMPNSMSGLWTVNDPLRLYWFPTLTTANNTVSVGTPYNFFPNHSGEVANDAWRTPASGSPPADLNFLTVNASGTFPESRGVASLTVVPEPSFYAGMFAAGCFAWGMISRRRKVRN